ncbi:excinuclease ABC subunit UvrB [Candidatus Berkelbacteria bacterium]|nr:excinuclease ABC subunit UvrB [Candidatus Berkelbacteria bacterium]
MNQGTSFELIAPYRPAGDQPTAIGKLVRGLQGHARHQTLLGVTGSGKTFTIANVLARVNRPALVLAHNKTLAAQLTQEFRTFFPNNAVEYFVSYYDYYQPEAYVPSSDTYIEKEAEINDEIDRLRHAATTALLSRRDVIIVASVSAIYGLGSPQDYEAVILPIRVGDQLHREDLIQKLVSMYFTRDETFLRGTFSARGSIIDIIPASEERIYRIQLEGNRVISLSSLDLISRTVLNNPSEFTIFPAKHFVVSPKILKQALISIQVELEAQVATLKMRGKEIEADRLNRRTRHDLALMRELGYCNGIENYSRHLTNRKAGESPSTLLDYFPKNFITIIDESHVTIPQIGGMYAGDRARKETLIEYGFRLPSALDNRPLNFTEFEVRTSKRIYVSATPGPYERAHSSQIVEQVIRPTGLVDPQTNVRPILGQVDDAIEEITKEVGAGNRILVTTLTKKMAEDLAEFFKNKRVKAQYLHSEVSTLDRIRTLDELRKGKIDVIVGVNLLREGLDLPEVTLVLILDADKEGFLRSETSLIQTIGRAARNVRGRVILYADNMTGSMKRALTETDRRRQKQLTYNQKHGITPESIRKQVMSILPEEEVLPAQELLQIINPDDLPRLIQERERMMKKLAKDLKFEEAALARDEVIQLRKLARTFHGGKK